MKNLNFERWDRNGKNEAQKTKNSENFTHNLF